VLLCDTLVSSKFAQQEKKKRSQMENAVQHYKTKLLQKSMDAFKRRFLWLKQVYAVVDEKVKQRNMLILRYVWDPGNLYLQVLKHSISLWYLQLSLHSTICILVVVHLNKMYL
jgi:hypothetical protein